MKTFLNVVGLLALLGGAGGFLMGSQVQGVIGAIFMLVAVNALGLAKVIDLAEGAALAERIRRKAKLYAAISGIRISRPRPIATEVR